MSYEINVSKRGSDGKYRHFFATNERSCLTRDDMLGVYYALCGKFRAPEFQIDVTLWDRVGHKVVPPKAGNVNVV